MIISNCKPLRTALDSLNKTRKLQNALIDGPLNKYFVNRYERTKATADINHDLPADVQRIKDELDAKGIYITNISEIQRVFCADTDSMMQAVESVLEAFPSSGEGSGFGHFAQTEELLDHPASLTWLMKTPFYNMLENYFGLPVATVGPELSRSFANGEQVGTRRTHFDTDDRKMLRVFVYHKDISKDDGAFRHLPLEKTEYLKSQMKAWWQKSFDDKELQALGIQESDWTYVTGKKGTVVLVDTSRLFHSASVPQGDGYRDMSLNLFTSERPKSPAYLRFGLSLNGNLLIQATSIIKQHLSNDSDSPRYINSVNWARRLPPIIRALSGFMIGSSKY